MGLKRRIKAFLKKINTKEIIAIPTPQNIGELLQGKTALITGGSSGIGFAIAERFLAAGCQVIISGTNEEKLMKCCEKLGTDKVKGIVINLLDVDSIKSKIDEAAAMFDGSTIDILVNSAGFNPMKAFFQISEEDYDRTLDINVKGTFFMSQAIASYMIEKKIKGHILNISSSSALRPAWAPYGMSKWMIRGFTKGLADTLIPYGIIVNAIAPGPTATPMLGKSADGDLDRPSSPNKRYAVPEEIANLALVFVSDFGNLVVGDTLYATGGCGVITLHQ